MTKSETDDAAFELWNNSELNPRPNNKLFLTNDDSVLVYLHFNLLRLWCLPACLPMKSPFDLPFKGQIWDACAHPINDRFVFLLHTSEPSPFNRKDNLGEIFEHLSISFWDCSRNLIVRKYTLSVNPRYNPDSSIKLKSKNIQKIKLDTNSSGRSVLVLWELHLAEKIETALVNVPVREVQALIRNPDVLRQEKATSLVFLDHISFFNASIECIIQISSEFAVTGSHWGLMLLWRIQDGELLGMLPGENQRGKYDNLDHESLPNFMQTTHQEMPSCKALTISTGNSNKILCSGHSNSILNVWNLQIFDSKIPKITYLRKILFFGSSITRIHIHRSQKLEENMIVAGDNGGIVKIFRLPSFEETLNITLSKYPSSPVTNLLVNSTKKCIMTLVAKSNSSDTRLILIPIGKPNNQTSNKGYIWL